MDRPKTKEPEALGAPPETGSCLYPLGTTPDNVALAPDQVLRLLRRAALHPGMAQQLTLLTDDGQVAQLRLKHGPGGQLVLHPADAGTPLAAALGAALERLGALGKLGFALEPFPCTPVAKAPGRLP